MSMTQDAVQVDEAVRRESELGRLPLLSEERVWNRPAAFMWTAFAFGAATWAFLTGGLIGTMVDAPRGFAAIISGHWFAFAVVLVAAAIPCAKYGIDNIDFSKSMFGSRGTIFPMFVLVTTILGWVGVLIVLAQQAMVAVWNTYLGGAALESRWAQGSLGLILLVASWLFVSAGPRAFFAVAKYVGPGLLLLAAAITATIVWSDGLEIFTKDPEAMTAGTPHAATYAILLEFTFGFGFSWWNATSAYARLSRGPRVATWGLAVGWSCLGAGLILVGVLGGLATGASDITEWMVPVLGLFGGLVALTFVILANWTSIAGILYIVGVTLQQVRTLRRIPWTILTGLLALPGLYLVFYPEWFLSQYPVFLAYNAIFIAPICAVQAVDYYLLRKQRLDLEHLFEPTSQGKYWFWGGFNWIALASCLLSAVIFLWIYDPWTTEHRAIFPYTTATIPALLFAALSYYAAMRIVIPRSNRGFYPNSRAATDGATPVDVDAY